MTTQIPDTCMFDGRRWAINDWAGDMSTIPNNQQIGIETVSPHTANWSGRIDHFSIHRGRLYLLKIEVNLVAECRDKLPDRAQREVVCRYEKMRLFDKDGERYTVREHRFEYLVFHDLFIPYSGVLFLSYPCIDYWEQPFEADDTENGGTEIQLTFADGLHVRSGDD